MIETRELAEELVGELFHGTYALLEELTSGLSAQVYRARDLKAQTDVSIKILWRAGRGQGLERYLEFQRQARAIEQVGHPRVVRLLALERSSNAVVLVEEYSAGALLSQFVPLLPFPARLVPTLLQQVAEALRPYHEIGLYHRRLTPGSILLAGANPERGLDESWQVDVRILGFGHSLLSDPSLTGDEPVEDFAYTAPERVGMLPQLPDARADLYSLGVLAYQLLSGRLPFDAPNSGVYLHRVMAMQPQPLRGLAGQAPQPLVRLVERLMARSPEDRPPSTAAFAEELKRASMLESAPADLLPEALAGGVALKAPPLVERDAPLKRLRARLDLALRGEGSLVLVEGNSGDGKTRLVEELRGHVESSGGVFLAVQATEPEKNLPFQAVREVVEQYVALVKVLAPERRAQITTRLNTAVGSLGGGLFRVLPAVRELLSGAREPVPLDPERERQRFITTVLNFFLGIAVAEQPLLLFFDDLHWVDPGSREIFEKLAARAGRAHLLLVGAYRSGKDAPAVGAERLLALGGAGPAGKGEGQRRAPAPAGGGGAAGPVQVERIQLEPLTFEGTLHLLQSALELESDSLTGLPEMVFERAQGNVRFTLEIARLLGHELGQGHPSAPDLARMRGMVPGADARDIVLHRVDRLDAADRELLASAAVIGRKFPLRLLVEVAGRREEEVRRAVQRGLVAQVIAPYSGEAEDVLYFVDEDVQGDLYNRVEPQRRRELHERLGDLLAEADGGSRVFEVAYHYLRSEAPAKAAVAALRAGDEAKRGYANLQAAQLYVSALQAAAEAGGSFDRARVLEDLGDVHGLLGQYPQAERAYRESLEPGGDRLRVARLWGKLGDTYFRRGDNREALVHFGKALRSLGFRLPRTTAGVAFSILHQVMVLLVRGLLPRRWLRLRRESDRALAREAVKIYHTIAYAYYFIDIARTLDIHLRQLNLAERIGPSRELAQTYSDHGIVCSIVPWHRRALAYQEAGLAMRQEIGDEWGVGQSHGFLGVCCYYRAEWTKAIEHFRESIRILEKMGDQWEVEAAYIHAAFTHRLLGDMPAASECLDTLLALSREINDRKFQAFGYIGRSQVLAQRGDLDLAIEDADRALALEVDNLTRAMALRVKSQILIRHGVPQEALKVIQDGSAIIRANHIRNEYVAENHVAAAETLIADGERILALGARERRLQLRAVRLAVRYAVRISRSFPNTLGYALRVRASYHWLRGSPRRALADFARSAGVLRRQGARYELGRTQLDAGRWLVRVGDPRGVAYLDEAIHLFQEVGARRDLEEARELRVHGAAGSWVSGAEVRRSLRNEQWQLASLFKVSQSVTSILELDRLLRRAVDLAIEVLGAERGFILLAEEGKPEPAVRVGRDVSQRDLSPPEYGLNAEVIRRVFAEQKPWAATEEVGSPPGAGPSSSRPLRSVLCVPLVIKDRPIGLIYVENRLVKDLYREPDIDLLSAFAAQLAVAIENARAYEKIEELNIGLEEKVRERTAELVRAKMVLEKANLMKDEFLANMSHELRTPLNAVIALADILGEETFGPLNDKQRKYVGDIVHSGTHLLSLINDILDLSKIEAGQMQLLYSDFDLNALLGESLVMVKERAAQHSIALKLALDPALPAVRADHRKIKQVVFNLLSNAVKFTEDGGRVTIRSRRGQGEVVVTIEDTGIGIAPENLGKIFVEFQQIDSSLSRKYPGTGLGLALSRRIVELHRGKIWAESELKKGSRFSFSIPMISGGAEVRV